MKSRVQREVEGEGELGRNRREKTLKEPLLENFEILCYVSQCAEILLANIKCNSATFLFI